MANAIASFVPHITELNQVVKIITKRPETINLLSKRNSLDPGTRYISETDMQKLSQNTSLGQIQNQSPLNSKN